MNTFDTAVFVIRSSLNESPTRSFNFFVIAYKMNTSVTTRTLEVNGEKERKVYEKSVL
jgi:hypothetical protein